MKKTLIYLKLLGLVLLLLSAASATAQRGLQYWIDDFSNPKLIPMPAVQGNLRAQIHVEDLSPGLHTIFMRSVSSDGTYSPITSAPFLKIESSGETKLDMWLDDDLTKVFSHSFEIDPEAGKELKLKIDFSRIIADFPFGTHKLSMRVHDDILGYGAVYSSYFTHLPEGGSSNITFWFDGDMTKKATFPVTMEPGTATDVRLKLDLNNIIANFPFGSHEVSMRVYDDRLGYGAVYSSNFTHLPEGGSSNITFWLDGDMTKKVTFPIDMNNEEKQYKVLDLNNLLAENPYGSHELSMRLYDDKQGYGAVYSSNVLHVRHGEISHLDYWLDDDYANHRTLNARSTSGKVATFDNYINLKDMPAGVYYLRYRVPPSGAVYETAVLVERRYTDQLNVYIEKEAKWFDNNEPSYFYNTGHHVNTYNNVYLLDPADFGPGQHELHLQYMNSAGVWTEQNVTYFYKDGGSKLCIGFMPDETEGLTEEPMTEELYCTCEAGIVKVDCRSPRLGETGEVTVYDLMGRLIASQTVSNMDGIHAELDVSGYTNQLLIVRLVSGSINVSRKIMFR